MPSRKRSTILTAGLATFFLLLAFAACSETGTPSPTAAPTPRATYAPAPTPAPAFNVAGVRAELEAAKALWGAKGSADYTVEYEAFLGTSFVPMQLTVRDGVIVQAKYLGRGRRGKPVEPEFDWRLKTIEGLFEEIRVSVAGRAWKMSAEYDPHYGYPRKFGVTYSPNLVDDYFGGGFSNYQPLDPSAGPEPSSLRPKLARRLPRVAEGRIPGES